ncbi:MAG: hypothetical protein F6K17_09650 [Okeania sp. SIO3C4]|nr:hypothetical protein [Okeania sp. SIO3B3]NER02865.1 hypothetical protein [Okeania sp. SIO3C4]
MGEFIVIGKRSLLPKPTALEERSLFYCGDIRRAIAPTTHPLHPPL